MSSGSIITEVLSRVSVLFVVTYQSLQWRRDVVVVIEIRLGLAKDFCLR
jgi:hypothetical protein